MYRYRFCILLLLYAIFALPTLADAQADSIELTRRIDLISVTTATPTVVNIAEVQGSIDLGLAYISRLPGLAGSADPVRTLQLMPGVQTSGEISNGLYIRGSQNSHNLVELDGAHIYNPMHLLGIFSVFNDDNLSSFTLHKSYIPPRYGGRIGSVISARSQTVVPYKFSASGEAGLIASNITLGIPLGSRSGLYLSGRASYLNPVLKLLSSKDKMRLGYDMYDTGANWIFTPSSRDDLSVNFYLGRDNLSVDGLYASDGSIGWGNIAASATWEHRFDETNILSQTVSLARYDNNIDIKHSSISVTMPSSITDIGYEAIFRNHRRIVSWEYGLDYTLHHVLVQVPAFKNYFFDNVRPSPIFTHEGGIFAEAVLDISPAVKVRGGMRASLLVHGGNDGGAKAYCMPEPRLNVTVRTSELSTISVSGGIQQQYVNQVASSNNGFPTDFWIPSSSIVPPQRAYSSAVGYRRWTKDKTWEFSAELYYKALSDQMESKGGMITDFNSGRDIYSRILYGRGRNFGLEVLVGKTRGRFSGWISYTLGWAQRSFPDIDAGRWFPMTYERRHDLSLTAVYRIGGGWTVSSNFIFATGNAYTPVVGVYAIGESPVNEYGAHNSSRMPPYHRMDVAATYDVRSKRLPGRLTISVYNLYARKNPIAFYAYAKLEPEDRRVNLTRRPLSLYSIIPSVSYSFRF